MSNALDVAMYLVHLRDEYVYCKGCHVSLNNMKVQKLMFYCQGVHYALTGDRLITNDGFAAWRYGPSIESVHKLLSIRGNLDVPHLDHWVEYGYVRNPDRASVTYLYDALSDSERYTIELVWRKLKDYSGFELADATKTDIAWKTAWENGDAMVSEQLIRESFVGLSWEDVDFEGAWDEDDGIWIEK